MFVSEKKSMRHLSPFRECARFFAHEMRNEIENPKKNESPSLGKGKMFFMKETPYEVYFRGISPGSHLVPISSCHAVLAG
jgi:hypothetical protein